MKTASVIVRWYQIQLNHGLSDEEIEIKFDNIIKLRKK